MEFTDVIEKRYSCKNYSARKVEEGKESGLNGARLFSKGAKRGKIEENAKENSHGTDER